MKEFFNWLGVNEKIAKLIFWLFVIMIFLIIFNTTLESIGLPYYKVTIENLSKIKLGKVLDYMCTVIVSLMNFYSIIFLVVKIKKFKSVFPYSILYIVLMMIISETAPYIVQQIFIPLYIAMTLFFINNKNKRSIILGIISLFINSLIQYACFFLFKIRFVDYNIMSGSSYLLASIDYFIVMFFIILVKEVYLKYKKEA